MRLPAQGLIAPRPLPAHLGRDGLRRVRVGDVGSGFPHGCHRNYRRCLDPVGHVRCGTGAGGCDGLEPRDDAKMKAAFEATGLVLKGSQRANIKWQCLPDAVDPRGPKTK